MYRTVARIAGAILLSFGLGAPIAASAQQAPSNNQIVVSKDVVGTAPDGTAYSIRVECSAIDTSDGVPDLLSALVVVNQTVTFDANGNPAEVAVDVPAITDRDEGFVLCSLNEDPATRPALLTSPTFVVSDPGSSRAADPQTDPVVGGPIGDAAAAQFAYTRSGAVVHVTFINNYSEPSSPPPPPVEVAPLFTG
jgi:hypothetical protein